MATTDALDRAYYAVMNSALDRLLSDDIAATARQLRIRDELAAEVARLPDGSNRRRAVERLEILQTAITRRAEISRLRRNGRGDEVAQLRTSHRRWAGAFREIRRFLDYHGLEHTEVSLTYVAERPSLTLTVRDDERSISPRRLNELRELVLPSLEVVGGSVYTIRIGGNGSRY